LLPRRFGGARRARGGGLGRVLAAAEAVALAARARGGARTCPVSTAAAYDEVLRITRREAKNFAYGIMVLPRDKRRAIAAIYAFARRVDDIADGELSVAEKRAQLEQLRGALDAAPGEDAMLVALADARTRFPIPEHALHALVDGGLQDLEQSRYA